MEDERDFYEDDCLDEDEGFGLEGSACATCWCKGVFCDCCGCTIQEGRNVCENCEDNS
ncbi:MULTISPECIES: hypothetical protein [Mesotoga]|uniref:Uncharacterized protein n=1 Tax=Mesotoga prima MesG1.Ag.4.2 TaxID=660470 RepID=I2F5T5_9BACT|nr:MULTISPECIES: hypothetical protein [Mesotoga]AFK07288.1 hypothetical protein Theba_1624 [Mesotoga prima MesG1.Ag.4.2]